MAKKRGREPGRARTPPPPRMTGLGLVQVGLICGFLAIIFGLVGVLGSKSGEDPALGRNADHLGAGLASLLTAPDPESWLLDYGTDEQWRTLLRKYYRGALKYPTLAKAVREQLFRDRHFMKERNKERLASPFGNFTDGLLRGLQIQSSNTKRLGDQAWGARIRPQDFRTTRAIFDDIQVGTARAANPGGTGTFLARVYRREYVDHRNISVGHVYVLLDEALLLPAGGSNMWLFLTPLLVALAVGGFLVFATKTSEGIKGVARDLDAIGRGRLDQRITITGSGEVGFLQRTADRMAKNLQLIQTTGSGDLDEALEKELDLANQIHQSLRPSDPPRLPGYELETLFKPGVDIGGDYHDYIDLDERRMAVVLADCSESLRGVPAAMVMAMMRAYLKASIDPETSPAAWLKLVNRRLARDLKSGMAVTALVAVLDTSTHEIVAASAGHRPIVIWRKNKTATVNPNGIALGLDVGPVFEKTMEEKKFTLEKNDRIVLFTDGVISAENEAGEAYGEDRFLEAVRRQGAMNSAAFVNFIAGGVDKFLEEIDQNDDITVCTVKRMK